MNTNRNIKITNIKSFGIGIKSFMLCLMLIASGCSKFLDVKPEGELPSDQLLKDAKGFESALYGVYATLNKPTLYGEHLSHNMVDLLAQYFECAANDRVESIQRYDYKHSLVETSLLEVWRDMYYNISNINSVLLNLENFTPESMRHYNLYKGEALGLRAFMHFDLVRLYTENIQRNASASGIPYSTDFSLSPSDFQTAAKIYDLIIADLKEAETLLQDDVTYKMFPKVNPTDNFLRDRETHFNLYAVQATLARVYFTQGDLPNALVYAEKVISSGKFLLMNKAQIGAGYTRGVLSPSETIFGVFSRNYFTTARERFLIETTRFSYNPRANLRSTFESQQVGHDYRWDGGFQLPSVSAGRIRFVKLVDPYQVNNLEFQRPAELVVGINLIRLPEMYYIAAEALLESNHDRARDYFDTVLESRGLTGLQNRLPAEQLTLSKITADRYKEFIGEGQTFFNMKRLHQDITNINLQTVPASNSIYVLPIPLEETDYRK